MQRAPDTLVAAGHPDRQTAPASGAIQPHGVMLVVSPGDYLVLHASANAGALLGAGVTISPGMPLGDIVGRAAAHAIRNASAKSGGGECPGVALSLRLTHAPDPVDVVVHRRENRVIMEFEPSRETGAGASDALDMSLAFARRLNAGIGTEDLAMTGARLMRAMLGYDRVMICKWMDNEFLDRRALRVIAEAKRANQPCLLGQELDQELDNEFSAGEIADQQCSFHASGAVRIIVDATAVPVPLEPALHPGDQPVDMSLAQLRPASAAHCRYLGDLGVVATLSVPIIVGDRLWGLILCRHDSPRTIPVPLRMAAELFGHTLSMHMTVAEHLAQAQGTAPDEAVVAASPRDNIAGLTILLVEDEYLIALDTEDMLQSRDVAGVRVAQDAKEAAGILETCTPDAAVLDFNLGAHTAQALAERLLASGVPVIFVTGYGDNAMIPEHLRTIPVARKPATSADLEQQLLEAFKRFRPAV